MKRWLAAMCGLLVCCGRPALDTEGVDPEYLANFAPAPEVMESKENPFSEEKAALGKMLYYETRLSKEKNISCNSCHPLDGYGVDGQPVSTGHKGQRGSRNAPTVYFAAGHKRQFWDGRAETVEEQAKGPMMNPVEMAMADAKDVEQALRSIAGYGEWFRKAFPGEAQPVTLDNAARAIGAFERKLVTVSRWDRFLKGDKTALNKEEQAGFLAFYKSGCVVCHGGQYLGGQVFMKLGLYKPWPKEEDTGRSALTKKEADRMMFKAPSLRNIEKTGPYFHDGSVGTLEETVRLMSEHQLERPVTESEQKRIVAWLRSLTGDLPAAYIAAPTMPK
ncbi:MAG: c-type cytochrome [Bryobacterales bacterium]|nr:c-type cytochrome [Bryobacterales bacterium]